MVTETQTAPRKQLDAGKRSCTARHFEDSSIAKIDFLVPNSGQLVTAEARV
jgi:hypothetical protein